MKAASTKKNLLPPSINDKDKGSARQGTSARQQNTALNSPNPASGPGSASHRSSQLSSVRLINEADFEGVFKSFKENRISGQFGKVYDTVLSTVGTAHEKNKKQRLE